MKVIIKDDKKQEILNAIKDDTIDRIDFKFSLVYDMVDVLRNNDWILTVKKTYNNIYFTANEDEDEYKWDFSFFKEYNGTKINKYKEDKVKNINIVIKDKEIISMIDNNVGTAKFRDNAGVFNENFGILLSVVRALDFDEDFQDKIIDLYYGNLTRNVLNGIYSADLIKELYDRFH